MRSVALAALVMLGWSSVAGATPPEIRMTEGLRERTPRVFALTDATIIPSPGNRFSPGTLIIRDGRVEAVGEKIAIPADAHVISLRGKIVYPGFINAFTQQRFAAPPAESESDAANGSGESGEPADSEANAEHVAMSGLSYGNALVTPEFMVSHRFRHDHGLNAALRSQGFVARLVAPEDGIIRGVSAVVETDDGSPVKGILNRESALHVHLYVSRSPRRITFPNSPMGAVALARQAFLDADWYRRQRLTPVYTPNESLDSLQTWLPDLPPAAGRESSRVRTRRHTQLVMFDADTEQYLLRAEQFAQEFGLRAAFRGGGREYRRIDEIAALQRPIVVPVVFPAPPYVASPEAAFNAELDDLMHWDLAPENPARLERAGVSLALTTHGLSSPNLFLANLRKAVARGWSPQAALAALTTTPAELLALRDRLGAIEPGLLASLVVADGDLFAGDGRVTEVWIRGRRLPVVKEPTFEARGTWRVKLTAGTPAELVFHLGGAVDAPTGEWRGADTVRPLEHLVIEGERLSFTFDAGPAIRADQSRADPKVPGRKREGQAQVSVNLLDEGGTLTWAGTIVWPDGSRSSIHGVRESTPMPASVAVETMAGTTARATAGDTIPAPAGDKPSRAGREAFESFDVNYPLGAFGRAEPSPPRRPAAVLFRRGTIWTCGPAGVLSDADLLIVDGKVAAVGARITPPAGAEIVDLAGRHVTPGLIDPHSHIATDGGVNETGRAITCQVRIADFTDANDVNIYRQLAGGTTTALILHGSACPIGGQGEVIKFRWGLSARDLRFAEAPPTVKFALGENVTKGPDILAGRYPHSRMGVEQLHRDAFVAAREYQRRWDEWRATRKGSVPRRDLELECLAEVLAGKRWIHCHCYRQDEILAFLRVLEDFNVRVGCLHHVSEGYKVADAMLRHGAMGTTFSDWWAFKVETLDAIAHNAAFLHRAGIVTSFHSDDRELGRHMNHEAAKAMRYGQLTAEEALKLVTIAPARQLRVEAVVGSLEPGKHADLVVWNQAPVSTFARCDQTWIDGRKYFDRDDDVRQRSETQRRKAILVQKVLASGEAMMPAGLDYSTDKESWDREDKYCRGARQRIQAP